MVYVRDGTVDARRRRAADPCSCSHFASTWAARACNRFGVCVLITVVRARALAHPFQHGAHDSKKGTSPLSSSTAVRESTVSNRHTHTTRYTPTARSTTHPVQRTTVPAADMLTFACAAPAARCTNTHCRRVIRQRSRRARRHRPQPSNLGRQPHPPPPTLDHSA